jgi:hypothetical protein
MVLKFIAVEADTFQFAKPPLTGLTVISRPKLSFNLLYLSLSLLKLFIGLEATTARFCDEILFVGHRENIPVAIESVKNAAVDYVQEPPAGSDGSRRLHPLLRELG